jgi:hypothetical protein
MSASEPLARRRVARFGQELSPNKLCCPTESPGADVPPGLFDYAGAV